MKKSITTKDLLLLNELILFEQWAATKYRHYYDALEEKSLKKVVKEHCLTHSRHHENLFDYVKVNAGGGEKQ